MDVVKLGILGGTFDPIHNGHLELAQAVAQSLALPMVVFVPVGDPPHKQRQPITPAAHRLRMVELALAERPKFAVSRVDVDRPGPHYSVDTVRLLRGKYNVAAEDCYFILGADTLMGLPSWYKPGQLLELCRLAVVHRPGYHPNLSLLAKRLPGVRAKITWVAMPDVFISATAVRHRVAQGLSIAQYVPARVARYIAQHNLYKPQSIH